MAARVAESLFLETLRGYLEALPPQERGWLAGVRDPQVGRCLALMHAQPARAWSLESLAQGSPADVLLEAALSLPASPLREVVSRSRLEASTARQALQELLLNQSLIQLEEGDHLVSVARLAEREDGDEPAGGGLPSPPEP